MVELPGVQLNAAGGNAMVRRVDLSIDTRLGGYELGATYNSASGQWRWSFEERYDGSVFTDASGAVSDTTSLSSGEAIPGSVWVVVGPRTVATKGGLVHEFDSEGQLAFLHWSISDYPRLAFARSWIAGEARVTAIEQCVSESSCAPVFALEYDVPGRLVRVVDRADRVAEFGYDEAGRLTSARDGLDVLKGWPGFRYEYDGDLLTAIVNSEGERIEYSYLDGRLRGVQRLGNGGEPAESYLLDYGWLQKTGLYFTTVWGWQGGKAIFRYDDQGRLREFENDEGDLVRSVWQGLRPTRLIDAAGVVTRSTWSADDLVERIEPSGNVVRFSYAANAANRDDPYRRPILEIADSLGLIERRSYDAEGRLMAIENGAGETGSFSYDAEEALSSATDAAGVVTSFSEYGEHGHAVRLEQADAVELRSFDAVGNRLDGAGLDELTDAGRPGIVSRSYDADRNLEKLELAAQRLYHDMSFHENLTEYRSDGRPKRISRPYGGVTEFEYDALGRLVERRERVDGQWRAVRYEYDRVGRLVAEEQPNGMRREQHYDSAGRTIELRWLRDGVVESYRTFTYADGRLISSFDSVRGGSEFLLYNSAGRPWAHQFPQGEGVLIGYDLRGRERQRSFHLEDGRLLRRFGFGYDAVGRQVRLSEGGIDLLERVYANGRLERVTYGNGLERSFDYDGERGHLIGSTTVDAAAQVVERSELEDGDCSPTGMRCIQWTTGTHPEGGSGVVETSRESYLLDPTNAIYGGSLLVGPRLFAWAGEEELLEVFSSGRYYGYDALGNIDEVMWNLDLTHTYEYNLERNRLLSAGEHSYEYDAAGYVTRRDGIAFDWTAAGRIAAIGSQYSFEWDALGQLVASQVEGIERRTRFGGQVRANALGEPVSVDLDEVVVLLGEEEHRYRHHDFRKNVKFVSDDAGQVILHYQYSAYGVEAVHGYGSDDRSFAQGWEIGDLMILGARVYDPDVGRFLSPETLYHPVNQFAYTLGNPVDLWDPTGRQATPVSPASAGALSQIGSNVMIGGFMIMAAGVTVGVSMVVLLGSGLVAVGIAMILVSSVMGVGSVDQSCAVSGFRVSSGGFGGLGSGGGIGSPGALGDGSNSGSCAPTRLVNGPDRGGVLSVLVLLQLILGLALARGRRRRRRESR